MRNYAKRIIALAIILVLSFSTTIATTAAELGSLPTITTVAEDESAESATDIEDENTENVDTDDKADKTEDAEDTTQETEETEESTNTADSIDDSDESSEETTEDEDTEVTESDTEDTTDDETEVETELSTEEDETEEITETEETETAIFDEEDDDDRIGPGVWSDKVPYFTDEVPAISDNVSTMRRAPRVINYPTYEEAYQLMIALQKEIPEGMVWTNKTPYGINGIWGDTYWFRGGAVKGARGGVGCAGFGFRVSDEGFGDIPCRVIDAGNFTFEDIKVGDILRTDNDSHFVIVLRVTKSSVIVAEGNYNGTAHWGRAISKAEVMATTNFIVTRYPVGYSEDETSTEITAQGTEGNLKWVLASNGVLTISGNGNLPNYTETVRPSWEAYKNKVYTVEIQDGITSVGNYAFYKYDQLITTYLPDSVTSIGKGAYQSSNITNITIPGSVQDIGDDAFNDCKSLVSFTASEGVQTIGISAFKGCRALNNVDFPSTITQIGSGAFTDCDELRSVRFAPGNVTVTMGDNMFSRCYRLNDVTLPLKADKISSGMFSACGALKYLYIPANVGSFEGVGSLSGGPFQSTGLQLIEFGGSEQEWKNKGGNNALQYSGLLGKTTVKYNVTFTNPFAPDPDDPEDIVFPCKDGHTGEADADGNCTVCGDPFEPKETEPSPTTPDNSDNSENSNNGGNSSDSDSSDSSNSPNDSNNSNSTDNNDNSDDITEQESEIATDEDRDTPNAEITDITDTASHEDTTSSETTQTTETTEDPSSQQFPPKVPIPLPDWDTHYPELDSDDVPHWSNWEDVVPQDERTDIHWPDSVFYYSPDSSTEENSAIVNPSVYSDTSPITEESSLESEISNLSAKLLFLAIVFSIMGAMVLVVICNTKNDKK